MTFLNLQKFLSNKISRLSGQVGLYVKFLNSNQEYKYNEGQQFWAASTIKIPIALAFLSFAESDGLKIENKVSIEENNYVRGSGILKLLEKSTLFTYKDLLTLMLVVSDNTAANQILDNADPEKVENFVKNIGLKNTTVRHKMMIKAGKGPNLTTPYDMGILLEKMYKNELAGSEQILRIMQEQLDRTRIPLYLPNNINISYKSGSLEQAVHEVGMVWAKNPFIFCFYSDEQNDKRTTSEVLSQCAKKCFDYAEECKSNQLAWI